MISFLALALVPASTGLVLHVHYPALSPYRGATRAAVAGLADGNPTTTEDEPAPLPTVGKELRIDADQRGLGVIVLGASVAIVPLLAFVVASTLGMGMGSPDNEGLGVPLSTAEARALESKSGVATSAEEEEARLARGLTAEEAREEEALVRVLRSEPLRGR